MTSNRLWLARGRRRAAVEWHGWSTGSTIPPGAPWMAERLRVVRTDPDGVSVVQGLIIDVTERREAEEALNQSERLRHEVLASLLRAEAEERNRIAAELHDDTVQELVAAQISIDRMLPLTVPPLTERLRGRSGVTGRNYRAHAPSDVRPSPPETLHAAGVVAAIEALGAQLAGEAGFEFSRSRAPSAVIPNTSRRCSTGRCAN